MPTDMTRLKCAALIAAWVMAAGPTSAKGDKYEVNEQWQSCVLAAVEAFPEGGGYYTGRRTNEYFAKTAWRVLNEAYEMHPSDMQPVVAADKAAPSFSSMAVYLAMIKALTAWDTDYKVSREAWYWLKPYCGIVDMMNPKGYNQADGEGCWGRVLANGPGVAVLFNDLKVGLSFTAYRGAKSEKNRENSKEKYATDQEWADNEVWEHAIPGDFMKIFWNRNETDGSDSGAIIGVTRDQGEDQEVSHNAIFLGYADNGDVIYWSSSPADGDDPRTGGYGKSSCPRTAIQRVVFSRVTKPENFDKASKYTPLVKVSEWLKSLRDSHSTTKELIKNCGIK